MKRSTYLGGFFLRHAVITVFTILGVCVVFVAFFQVYLWFCARCETEYAQGFSQRAFQEITPGQTAGEVLRTLGEPLERRTYEEGRYEIWFYTRSPNSTHYFLRAVRIECASNIVFDKVEKLYFD